MLKVGEKRYRAATNRGSALFSVLTNEGARVTTLSSNRRRLPPPQPIGRRLLHSVGLTLAPPRQPRPRPASPREGAEAVTRWAGGGAGPPPGSCVLRPPRRCGSRRLPIVLRGGSGRNLFASQPGLLAPERARFRGHSCPEQVRGRSGCSACPSPCAVRAAGLADRAASPEPLARLEAPPPSSPRRLHLAGRLGGGGGGVGTPGKRMRRRAHLGAQGRAGAGKTRS